MAMMKLMNEEVVYDEKLKKELKAKVSILMAETYKILKIYNNTFGLSDIESKVDIKINNDMFTLDINLDTSNNGMIKAVAKSSDGMTMNIKASFENDSSNSVKTNKKIEQQKKEDKKRNEEQVKVDYYKKLQNIIKDIITGMSTEEICNKYVVTRAIINRIKTEFNLTPPIINTGNSKLDRKRLETCKDRMLRFKKQIIEDLVAGTLNQKQIADKYQIVYTYLTEFKKTFKDEIEEEYKKKSKFVVTKNNAKAAFPTSPLASIKDKVDSDTEASIIEDLIHGEEKSKIAVKHNLSIDVINNIHTFNNEMINKRKEVIEGKKEQYADMPTKEHLQELINMYNNK